MELTKLILNLLVLLIPLIFKKDNVYDEKIKKVNEEVSKAKKGFSKMSHEERTIALSDLLDRVNTILKLRE